MSDWAQRIAGVLSGASRWEVICADNREVLPLIERADHVITDPPYSKDLYLRYRTNAGAVYKPSAKARRTDQAIQLANLRIGAIDDILDSCAAEFQRLASRWILAFHDLEIGDRWRAAFGRNYVRTGIWVKPNAIPQISGDRPGQGYETCTIAHHGRPRRMRWNGGGLPAVWTHLAENSQSSDRAAMGHPCPKPLSLMLELVSLFTDPGDIILDPFAGSGTTGVACLRLGRRFIGIEKDPTYAATATERLQAEDLGQDLRSYRAGQLAMFPEEKKRKAR